MSECVCELTPIDHETWRADVREKIVRCRDCLSWLNGNCYKHAYTVTDDEGYEYDEGAFPMDANDFCSLGTRREEA